MMFGRLLWKLLRGSRGRLAVALVALISGAAVISALLNLELDIHRKLTQEFRSFGANVVIAPRSGAETVDAGASTAVLLPQNLLGDKIRHEAGPGVTAAVPFLYIVARVSGVPVVVAGTDLISLPVLQPSWKLDGQWLEYRDEAFTCVVGSNVARRLHSATGGFVTFDYAGHVQRCKVSGILDTGASEDSQIFTNLAFVQGLANLRGGVSLVQLNVSGSTAEIAAAVQRLQVALPEFDIHPIRQITVATGTLLNRIRVLVVGMALLILLLTALCVLATMAALALERREDVGLMKALGGSISRVVGLFLAEAGVLGALGGALGCFAGVALSIWMGRRVFGTAISPRWEILPLTISLMVVVAVVAAFPLRLLGKVKPAVILRGE